MIDHRRETWPKRLLRFAWFIAGAITFLAFLYSAASKLGAPSSAIWRYREPASPPHVFVRGTLRRQAGSSFPPLCSVTHERYGSCGKSRCWKYVEGFVSAHASLDVTWSSRPLPSSVVLSSDFWLEPRPPPAVVTSDAEASAWKGIAQASSLGFASSSFGSRSQDRIVEACLDDSEQVFVEACTSASSPDRLEPCAGMPYFGVVAGEPQSAIDAAADDLAMRVAGAFAALFVGLLALVRGPSPLAVGLEDRAAPHRRKLGIAWSLLAVPPIAGFADLLLHASRPPSTWATGRGGFALGLSVLAVWILLALSRALHRRRTLAALAPVLATPRSPLASASGVVELAVRARLEDGGTRTLIGDDVVAFSEVRISERYQQGKNTSLVERTVHRSSDELAIVDESGDGVLDLRRAILDVELRKLTLPELSPRYAERGIRPDRHRSHVAYVIEERVIRDGEPLYVFGDVSGIELKANESGYRAVRGAPTLGGADVAPVLVYAGDERSLIARLTSEARTSHGLAVVAGLSATALASALAYLAWL